MSFCADASFIVRLYDPAAKASEVRAIQTFLNDDDKLVRISDLGYVEVLNVLLRKADRTVAKRFEHDVAEGIRFRVEPVDWDAAFQQAISLARRYSQVVRPAGHDLVLVAATVTMGAGWLLSFDKNSQQRSMAVLAGLQVWPPLDREEKGWVRHAHRRSMS